AANPSFHAAHLNLGFVLERQGLAADAVARWHQVVSGLETVTRDTIVYKAMALKQIGRMLKDAGSMTPAEQALRQSLAINPDQRDVLQHWISLRQQLCRWPTLMALEALPRDRVLRGISPLSVAAYTDDPMLHLAVAAETIKAEVGQPSRSFAAVHEAARAAGSSRSRLKIGYLSSDFREHAVGHLVADVLKLHDRGRVEVFAYYCFDHPSRADRLHQTFQETADHWVHLHTLADEAAAERISPTVSTFWWT
ncbi:MAG: hypothetical protein HC888_13770, partial [Candidatus Competibacteraceae bacterium]|nr:hypothetical protein [Candidatus Competibacteraceae bacterium]